MRQRYVRDDTISTQVPQGQVTVTPHGEPGWYLVQVGRARYTKRFNLSEHEIRELISAFASLGPA